LSIGVSGCGLGDKLKTYPVTGKVTFQDGKPLAGGALVTFQSVEHKVSASGIIGADGTCRLGTYRPEDGAIAGRHRVAISALVPPHPDETANIPKIALKYKNPETSGLECTVTPGGVNQFTFQVAP
jgi:hypothetical protein